MPGATLVAAPVSEQDQGAGHQASGRRAGDGSAGDENSERPGLSAGAER